MLDARLKLVDYLYDIDNLSNKERNTILLLADKYAWAIGEACSDPH